MLQYKIPQNVGIADKIVGPFSLKQLLIVAVGSGISYVLYAISIKLYDLNGIEYFVIALPLLISVAAALVKIQNVTLTHFLILLLEFSMKPKRRFWDHRGISGTVLPDLGPQVKKDDGDDLNNKRNKKNPNLKDLTRILDSGGFDHVEKTEHPDIDTSSDENLMYEAFFGNKKTENGEVSMYWRTAKDKEAYKRKLKLLSQLPRTEIQALKEVKDEIMALKESQKALHDLPAVQQIVSKPTPDKLIPSDDTVRNSTSPSNSSGNSSQPNPKPITQTISNSNSSGNSNSLQTNPKPIAKTMTNIIQKPVAPVAKQIAPAVPKVVPPATNRKRNKKKPPIPPVRPALQINNTQKNQPVKFIPVPPATVKPTNSNIGNSGNNSNRNSDSNNPMKKIDSAPNPIPKTIPNAIPQTPSPLSPKTPSAYPAFRGGEITMDNLQGGDIIEFNLED